MADCEVCKGPGGEFLELSLKGSSISVENIGICGRCCDAVLATMDRRADRPAPRARMLGGTEPTCPACFGEGQVEQCCELCKGSGTWTNAALDEWRSERGVVGVHPNANPKVPWTRPDPPKAHTHYVWDDDEACPLGWVAVCARCGNGPLTGEDETAGFCGGCRGVSHAPEESEDGNDVGF